MDSEALMQRLLTAIGHDMRQPLHALLLYLAALDRRVKDDDARAVLDKADRAARALAAMFDTLTTYARIETNKVVPDVAAAPLQPLFDDLAAQPGIHASPTPLSVRSDPALLAIILQSLTSNAVIHGGGEARLSAAVRDGGVDITVGDAGPGIAADNQERIFAPFTRLDGAPADGLGLGLTIARRLAAMLGHELTVQSSPGAGASFTLRAPPA
jgi:signal transduction histidine kinase